MMNRAPLPDMLQCLHTPENFSGNATDMSVLERQRAQHQQQQQQQQQLQQQKSQQSEQSYFNDTHFNFLALTSNTQQFQGGLINDDSFIRELAIRSMGNSDLENGCLDFGKYPIPRSGFSGEIAGFGPTGSAHMDHSISRTSSSPPVMVDNMTAVPEEKVREKGTTVGKDRYKKRKTDNAKVVVAEETSSKKIKGDAEEVESKITDQINNNSSNSNNNNNNNNNNTTRETSADNSKDNSKVSEVQKPDYIHVRARRGQATDSHSLAERVRREKISERMKYLQDLVPGCNKIIGKAGMLDEIINYVQSLQRQVEFLSMKLAAVNPKLEININNFAKEIFPSCTDNFPTIEMLTELADPTYLRFNPMQQAVSCCGLDMAIYPPEMSIGQRTAATAPVPVPEIFMDSSCFSQAQPSSSTWDTDLPSFYNVEFHQGRQTAVPSQSFTGTLEGNNLKMEM